MDTSAELLKQAIDDAAQMVRDEQATALPHPSVTNQYLHKHLGAVTSHPYAMSGSPARNSGSGLADRARRARDLTKNIAAFSPAAQKEFNYSLVQLLHQLEHRTRRQEMEINRLNSAVTLLKAQSQQRSAGE